MIPLCSGFEITTARRQMLSHDILIERYAKTVPVRYLAPNTSDMGYIFSSLESQDVLTHRK
jgi:hypothetical protein